MWLTRARLWLRIRLFRLADLALGRRRDRRLTDEIQGHLDELADTFIARGLSPDEARMAARRSFGGIDQVTASYRDERGMPFLDSLVQDAGFAARLLLRDRWFSLAGATALALGIAVTTTVFTMTNGIALQQLPVAEPDRIVHLVTADRRGRADSSFPDFFDWQRAAASFSGLAAYADGVVTIGDGQRAAERLADAYVTWNAFDVLRETPILGRSFGPADDRPGAEPVVILSHAVWIARFGADPAVAGRTIRIDGAPVTIIGVMREGFRFPVWADLWQPLAAFPGLSRDGRDVRTIGTFGRLRDDVTLTEAGAEMAAIAGALAAEYPASNQDRRIEVMPFTERYAGRLTEGPPLLMLSAVAVILLIACTNAAMLLLARAAPRAREVALRAALGASRARIVRQLLMESLLLSAVAGAIGFGLAVAAVRALRVEAVDLNLPYWMQFVFDARVFTFVAAICLVTALGSGLAPAWHLSGTRAHELLKDGGRGMAGAARTRRWSASLLVAQLALTLVLLAGAGLLTRSARALQDADGVLDPANLLTARLAVPAAKLPTPAERGRFYERLEAQFASHPSTRAAVLTTALPFRGGPSRAVRIEGEEEAATGQPRTAYVVAISDGYFTTLGLPLVRGRGFGPTDGTGSEPTAIVNQRFVEVYASAGDAVGRRLQLASASPAATTDGPWLTIVGVVASFRQSPMRDALPAVFVPLRAQPGPAVAVIVPHGQQPAVGATLTEAVRAVDPDVALFGVMPLQRLSELSRFNHRLLSGVLTVMAAIALFLSAIGLYGVTAFGVAQRTSEIGIRMALGAGGAATTWLFIKRTLALVALGIAIGVPGAIGVGRLLTSLLVQTSALDPLTFIAVPALLATVAVVACVIPARRATELDPITALRQD